MAFRRALLIAPLLLALAGWAGWRSGPSPEASCGGCHARHFVERGSCTTCHRGDLLALRKEIAHHRLLRGRAAEQGLADAPAVAEGRGRVERLACRRCHLVDGTGNRLATDLDRISWTRDQAELVKSIAEPVENMPRFGLDDRQVESVIAFLLRNADTDRPDATYRVRFSGAGAKGDSTFERRCGGCHRALAADGPLGRGSAGPNLSGVFSAFYPATAQGGRGWTGETLWKWLENPRSVRPRAAMRPVRLEAGELERLVEEMEAPAPRATTPRAEAAGG